MWDMDIKNNIIELKKNTGDVLFHPWSEELL